MKISIALIVILGAITTSKKFFINSFAIFDVIFLLNDTMPPKAEIGSQLKALIKALTRLSPSETPQGFECLIIETAGLVNSFTRLKALSASKKLL